MKSATTLLLLIILFSCDPTSNFLEIRNGTNIPVYFQLTCSDTLDLLPRLEPMEIVVMGQDTSFVRPDYFIEPYGSTRPALHGDWSRFADRCKDRSIKLFLIKEDQMERYDWEEMVEHHVFWEKMEVSSQHLRNNNFKVEFIVED